MLTVRTPHQSARALHALFALTCLALIVGAAAPMALAQGFTEFTISDPTFVTGPDSDFWVASAAPADFDADGDLDLLVSGYLVVYYQDVVEKLLVFRNDGKIDASTWGFTAIPLDFGGLYFHDGDLAWGDYDNDGDPDVLVAATSECALFRNDGGALHRTSTVLPAYWESSDGVSLDFNSIAWGDYDNDGDLDLIVPSTVDANEYQPTKLLRNDGPGAGDAWTFTDVAADLPISPNAISSWADMDGDGDLDLLHGFVQPGSGFLNTYRNDAGGLVQVGDNLAQIRYGAADWGDADNDGDLDIVYGGNLDRPDGYGETLVRILWNDGAGGYVPEVIVNEFQSPEEPWLDFNAVSWADYDSDGDVDLLVSGEWLGDGEIFGRSMVYTNAGGAFSPSTAVLPAPIIGLAGGAFTWFDVDNDGDLDYFVAGGYYMPEGAGLVESRTQLFRNDAVESNAPPTAPTGLSATTIGLGGVHLTWSPSVDDHTPANRLSYRIELGRAGTLMTHESALPEPGMVRGRTDWNLHGLKPGAYRWTVRALDTAMNGSDEAQGTFTLGTVSVEPAAGPALSFAPGPNPVRASDQLVLVLDHAQAINVSVFDLEGRRVAMLARGEFDAGPHAISLEPARLRSGSYFVRAVSEGHTASRRITVVR